jgi:hypothetical protein
MSYARFNDAHDNGQLSQFRDRLAAEVQAQTGQKFEIFQERADIAWGQNWQERIDEALDTATLLLVIITPGLFSSAECRAEVARFRQREQQLGRSDLILPVYYISAREIDDPRLRESDELARLLSSRRYADWRQLRFEPFTSATARKALAQLASRMRDSFWRPGSAADHAPARPQAGHERPETPVARPAPGATGAGRADRADRGGPAAARGGAMTVEVAIGPGGGPGRFRVQVVRSPAGEASTEVALDAAALLAARPQFEQTLLLSGITARQILTPAENAVRKTGQALFTALLGTGEVAGLYRASAALADARDEDLRIVLRLDAPELAGLPWEAMYDPGLGAYVCRRHPVIRHVPVAAVPPTLAVRPPLRVLGVVSAPRGLAALDTAREREQLTAALAGLAASGLAELVWAPSATWDTLLETLLAGPWHVLHFIGHGDFDADRDEGVLALTAQDGRADVVEASRFADLLRQARPMPRLVVLNSCSGAAAGADDLFSGTAGALARSGVAAVTAMQYAVSDLAAMAFARGFYAALAHGRALDEAVSAGRIAILGTSSGTLEWITPVMCLRGDSTRLFTLPAEEAASP